MKYFLDTEFHERSLLVKNSFFGKYSKIDTIELISIGIVAEDGREYYAISKDFNLKEAWNRYNEVVNKHYPLGPEYNKVYWLRDNVLKPICKELSEKGNIFAYGEDDYFTYKICKRLINKYGKTNKQIAEEVKQFINGERDGDYLIEILPQK
jgi:hypothetical protein